MLKWILIPLMLFLSVGCAKKSGGETTYLLPWFDADGQYRLQEVTLSTLSSPYKTEGSAAQVYYQPNFSDGGFAGEVARPNLTRSGNVYVPKDVPSSLVLAVYAQFEKLYFFEQNVGIAQQITWPRKVGVEFRMTNGTGEAHNNAHYFTELDVMGILPYTPERVSLAINHDRVPFSLNHGIIAHELFHAHFQALVMNPIKAVPVNFSSPKSENGLSVKQILSLNETVLRGWNEGLADFFAYVYTGHADFFSQTDAGVAQSRALDVPPAPMLSGENLVKVVGDQWSKGVDMGTAYAQGTQLARLLYRVALSAKLSPKFLLTRVMLQLPEVLKRVESAYASEVMDFDAIVPVLLKDIPVSVEFCNELEENEVVSESVLSRSFKCATN